ncbi:MAG: 4-(cytidine 5'-diphospho)-2-C-methyl-D-erythritol kinase [Fuerstiella sp.]
MKCQPLLQCIAPAKVNVFLEVLGKRDDGFHELETVMLRTTLCDVLQFQDTDQGQLSLQTADDSRSPEQAGFPLDSSNLILKAATALQQATGCNRGAQITISKKIPAEAGLAGGSSDAATTLLALNQLWNLNLPRAALHEIAATLGSDLNFFVQNCRAAVCRGRGEQVQPVSMNGRLHLVVARPARGNSTPQVFAGMHPAASVHSSIDIVKALEGGSVDALVRAAFNRLTEPARRLNPEMAELSDHMSLLFHRPVFMSGSGSTLFAFARSSREAGKLARRLQRADLPFVSSVEV